MKYTVIILAAIACLSLLVMAGFADDTQKELPGESLFNEYCLACHPGGSNIFDPEKTLHRRDLETHHIKTPEDIIHIMRNPGPQMTRFDKDSVPDRVAREIAEYILNNFK